MKIGDKVYMNKNLLGVNEVNIPGIIVDTWGDGFEVKEIETGYIYKCFLNELSLNKIQKLSNES